MYICKRERRKKRKQHWGGMAQSLLRHSPFRILVTHVYKSGESFQVTRSNTQIAQLAMWDLAASTPHYGLAQNPSFILMDYYTYFSWTYFFKIVDACRYSHLHTGLCNIPSYNYQFFYSIFHYPWTSDLFLTFLLLWAMLSILEYVFWTSICSVWFNCFLEFDQKQSTQIFKFTDSTLSREVLKTIHHWPQNNNLSFVNQTSS